MPYINSGGFSDLTSPSTLDGIWSFVIFLFLWFSRSQNSFGVGARSENDLINLVHYAPGIETLFIFSILTQKYFIYSLILLNLRAVGCLVVSATATVGAGNVIEVSHNLNLGAGESVGCIYTTGGQS